MEKIGDSTHQTREGRARRPISLINIRGKILEKLLIDRINHHLYSNGLLNENQYGFIPQRSTVDVSMAAKGFAHTHNKGTS
jgi:hypothetical protein